MPEYRYVLYRGKWAVEYYEEGKRFRRSLRTSERGDRDRALAKFAADHEASKRPDVITVEFAWNSYRKALDTKPAAVTMGHEWKAVGPHFGYMAADALTAGAVTEADCLSYATHRRAAGRSDGTIWTELGHLRSALKWAERKNLIQRAPAIVRPERPPPRDKRLTREQARKFLAVCEQPHVKLFVILAIATGARMGAILDLKWNRVDFDRREIRLDDPDRIRTNKRRALVPINDMAFRGLSEAREGATSPFVVEWGGHKVGSVKRALRGAGQRSGLPWVTAHVFRHSSASWMAEEGIPMAEIAQFLGHSDSRLTERIYARFSPNHLRKAAAALEL
jgi:integrase